MRFIHCGTEDFVRRTEEQRLVLIGASVQPHEAEKNLREKYGYDLSTNTELVVDNDLEKRGREFKLGEKMYEIQSSEVLQVIDWTNRVIFITSRCYLEVIKQLEQMPELEDVEVYAWACCIVLDLELTPEKKLERRIYWRAAIQYDDWLKVAHCSEAEKTSLRRSMQKKLNTPGFRVLSRVTLLHSNICSLRCRHCCDMIPQVQKPYYIPAEEVIENLRLLLSGVELCVAADLTDGEGLLYKELDKLLDYVLNEDKIETVLLISNGTVIPSEAILQRMRHPKFWLQISRYKESEKKLPSLCKILDEYGVQYTVEKELVWKDFRLNPVQKRDERREYLRYEFLRCCNKLCSKAYISRRLYGCMPAFRMNNLNYYTSDRDYVTIEKEDTPDQIWEKVYRLSMVDYIEACDYCNFENTGLSFLSPGC